MGSLGEWMLGAVSEAHLRWSLPHLITQPVTGGRMTYPPTQGDTLDAEDSRGWGHEPL